MDQANLKYVELEEKINRARTADYQLINPSNGKLNSYEVYRQEVIDRYFKGCYGKETKQQLLDIFEEVNKYIAYIMGV